MGDPGLFSIDLDELDAVIGDVEQTEADLTASTEDLERQIAALHAVWEGLAAQAQLAAQKEWDEGARAMQAALVDLRAAARTAHVNYTDGAQANVTMWESVS